MKLRVFALLSALLLAIVAPVSQAQLDPCLGLSASDCALINEASANTLASAQSFFQEWTIDFSVNGVPGSGAISFNAVGSGPVVLDMMNADLPLKFDQTINVSFNDGTTGDSGAVQARIVDGVFYFESGQGWMGVNLLEVANNPALAGQLPINPEDLMSGDIPGLDTEALGSALPALLGLVNTPGFLNYSRSGADFTFVADLAALTKSPDFSTALINLSGALGEQGQQIAGFGMILPMLLSEGKITVVQTVNEEARIVTGLQFLVNASVNAGMLTGDSAAAPVVVDLKFTVSLSRVNEAFDIVAPEGAMMMPLGQ
jgi:hypothetical protein